MFNRTSRTIASDDQAETPRRRRPSSAHVTAGLALFVALGGTSYAAGSLAANSVGSSQIKASAVKSSELAKSAVTSVKVKDGSLVKSDFKAGELPAGAQGAPGTPGAQGLPGEKGAPGEKGDTGSAGTNGVSGYQLVETAVTALPAGDNVIATATCPAGKVALGGGVEPNISTSIYVNRASISGATNNAYTARVTNASGADRQFRVQVTCITAN